MVSQAQLLPPPQPPPSFEPYPIIVVTVGSLEQACVLLRSRPSTSSAHPARAAEPCTWEGRCAATADTPVVRLDAAAGVWTASVGGVAVEKAAGSSGAEADPWTAPFKRVRVRRVPLRLWGVDDRRLYCVHVSAGGGVVWRAAGDGEGGGGRAVSWPRKVATTRVVELPVELCVVSGGVCAAGVFRLAAETRGGFPAWDRGSDSVRSTAEGRWAIVAGADGGGGVVALSGHYHGGTRVETDGTTRPSTAGRTAQLKLPHEHGGWVYEGPLAAGNTALEAPAVVAVARPRNAAQHVRFDPAAPALLAVALALTATPPQSAGARRRRPSAGHDGAAAAAAATAATAATAAADTSLVNGGVLYSCGRMRMRYSAFDPNLVRPNQKQQPLVLPRRPASSRPPLPPLLGDGSHPLPLERPAPAAQAALTPRSPLSASGEAGDGRAASGLRAWDGGGARRPPTGGGRGGVGLKKQQQAQQRQQRRRQQRPGTSGVRQASTWVEEVDSCAQAAVPAADIGAAVVAAEEATAAAPAQSPLAIAGLSSLPPPPPPASEEVSVRSIVHSATERYRSLRTALTATKARRGSRGIEQPAAGHAACPDGYQPSYVPVLAEFPRPTDDLPYISLEKIPTSACVVHSARFLKRRAPS